MLHHDINISYLIVFHLAVLYLTLLMGILFHSTQLYFSSILPYYTLLFIVLFV